MTIKIVLPKDLATVAKMVAHKRQYQATGTNTRLLTILAKRRGTCPWSDGKKQKG